MTSINIQSEVAPKGVAPAATTIAVSAPASNIIVGELLEKLTPLEVVQQ